MLATVTLDVIIDTGGKVASLHPKHHSLPDIEVDVDFDYGFPPSYSELGEDPSIEVLKIRCVFDSSWVKAEYYDGHQHSVVMAGMTHEVPEGIVLDLAEIIKDIREGWYDEQLISLAKKELAPDHEEKS